MPAALGSCVEKAHFAIMCVEGEVQIGGARARSPGEMSGSRGSIV